MNLNTLFSAGSLRVAALGVVTTMALGFGVVAPASAYEIPFEISNGEGDSNDDAGTTGRFDFSAGASESLASRLSRLSKKSLKAAVGAGQANKNSKGSRFAATPVVALAGVPVGNRNSNRAGRAGSHCYTYNADGSITMCAPAFSTNNPSASTVGSAPFIVSVAPRLTLAGGNPLLDRNVGQVGATAANIQPQMFSGDASISTLADAKAVDEPGTLAIVAVFLLGLVGYQRFAARDNSSIRTCASA